MFQKQSGSQKKLNNFESNVFYNLLSADKFSVRPSILCPYVYLSDITASPQTFCFIPNNF